jgi:hypothetical protein
MSDASSPRAIHGQAFWRALVDAGVFQQGDRVRRIIIDVPADGAVVMHVERWGDERLLDVALELKAAEIREVGVVPPAQEADGEPAEG